MAVLILQPPSTVLSAHIKALVHHKDTAYYCESILPEHVSHPALMRPEFFEVMREYLERKFEFSIRSSDIKEYVSKEIGDPQAGKNNVPRKYLLSPLLQQALLNDPVFDSQYVELLDTMRTAKLPSNDIMTEEMEELKNATHIHWDVAKLYDDPNLILRRYGGWCMARSEAQRQLTPKDKLLMKLTGTTMDEILEGKVPQSPRKDAASSAAVSDADGAPKPGSLAALRQASQKEKAEHAERRGSVGMDGFGMHRRSLGAIDEDDIANLTLGDGIEKKEESDDSDIFEVDPDHPKITPLRLSLSEAYLLIRGLALAQDEHWESKTRTIPKHAPMEVLGQNVTCYCKDKHMIAAAVLIDLYMREAVELKHWMLGDGNVAVCYAAEVKEETRDMQHWLDCYLPYVEQIFRNMVLPDQMADLPIWNSLEQRGYIDNQRVAYRGMFQGASKFHESLELEHDHQVNRVVEFFQDRKEAFLERKENAKAAIDAAIYSARMKLKGCIPKSKRKTQDDHQRAAAPRAFCAQPVDIFDFARPEWLPELKAGYLRAGRTLYDKNFLMADDERSSDMLMFIYVLQELFDQSFEGIDSLNRVLQLRTPPFQKGEIYPPLTMVHSGAVCKGMVERAFRVANGMDTDLAYEAAQAHESISERLEMKFFTSEDIWQAFDDDESGSLTLEEFVVGMQGLDLYKEFQSEKIPESVMNQVVGELAEKLFREVDVNMDGNLSNEELFGVGVL
mgnify:CR=1 FL=1